jgi:hypothetical protein
MLTKCKKEAIKHVEHKRIPTTVLLIEEGIDSITSQ